MNSLSPNITITDGFLEYPVYETHLIKDTRDKIEKKSIIHALSEINIQLHDGDKLAVLGCNGAGKTTLLKLIAGVYIPTSGSARSVGTIATLFELSSGFNPELSGFDNIYRKGMLLGLNKVIINSLCNEIIEFSGLKDSIYYPVRTYSSGMKLRLAFSIATCVYPDILLMDEWIAVGDMNFSAKVSERINEILKISSIVILASHSEELLRKHCNKGIILENGRIVKNGDIEDMLTFYKNSQQKTL